jgi:hypothetical protein
VKSVRKLNALAKLQRFPVKVSDGTDYNLQQYILGGVTLAQVRQALSGIRGSLADSVIGIQVLAILNRACYGAPIRGG